MSVFKNNTMDAAEFLAKLREVLSYDPDTGLFTWLVQPRRKDNRLGQTAGKVSTTTGYRFIGFKGKTYPAHRLAWLFVNGHWPDAYIDHINCNKTDNRIANLRAVSNGVNNCNRIRPRRDNSGLPMGVQKNGKRFYAKIKLGDKQVYLGSFDTVRDAGLAFDAAVRAHRAPHSATNESLGLI
jgi:hypothetical protein